MSKRNLQCPIRRPCVQPYFSKRENNKIHLYIRRFSNKIIIVICTCEVREKEKKRQRQEGKDVS
eukprot:04232_6